MGNLTSEKIRDYLVDVLKNIVAIPTVNPPGKNYGDAARYLADRLRDNGFDVDLIEVPEEYLDKHYPYSPQHKGHTRLIVYAKSGKGTPKIHFNGHYDVVPPGSGWSRDPFSPTVEGDRIYGRGTTDMKGGIASIVGLTRLIYLGYAEPKYTVEISFVPDEESGGIGAKYLVEEVGVKPDHVIIGEPSTSRGIVIGHKGLVRGTVTVHGKQVHGSVPWFGENAFVKASKLVSAFIDGYEKVLSSRKTRYPVKRAEGVSPTINLGGFAESLARKDNTVPGEFVFSYDRRVIPEENIDDVIEELKRHIDQAARMVGARYSFSVLSAVPASVTPVDSRIVETTKECVVSRLNLEPSIYMSFGRNDAVYFRSVGSYVINYGPGVEGVAHMPDEYNSVDELVRVTEIYKCVVENI